LACTKLDLAIRSEFLAIDWFNCNTGYVSQTLQLPYSSFLEWQVIQTCRHQPDHRQSYKP